MTLKWATPGEYVDALKAENVTWPVYYDEYLNYFDNDFLFWSGYYTSRPAFKKQIKDSQALYNSVSKMYARKMIDQTTSHEVFISYLKA